LDDSILLLWAYGSESGLIDAANTNIPNRVITVRKENPPWLTSSIKRVIRRKNRLHKRAKRSNLPEELVEQFRFFYVINYKITIMFSRGYSSAAFIVSC
jgi:hypothetical protein